MLKNRQAGKDFSFEQLPSNRREVFFDVIKVRFDVLLKAGFLNFLFLIPLIAVLFIKTMYFNGLMYQLSQEIITETQYASISFSSSLTFNALIIVGACIGALGLAGLIKIIRELIWYEPIFFKEDFLKGIKQNGKLTVLSTLLLSLVYAISDIVYKSVWISEVVRYIPYAILVIIALPLFLFSIAQISVYNNKLSQTITNSFILYIKSAPVTLGFSLILWVCSFLKLIPSTVIEFVIISTLAILVLVPYILAWFAFAFTQFDKHINLNRYPEIYRKALVERDTKAQNK